MIDGMFLRRVELDPSNDLARRTDLLNLQITSSLQTPDWERLVQPPDSQTTLQFRQSHQTYVQHYIRHISLVEVNNLFNTGCPMVCKNREIYTLCLINRIRYEVNYPLMKFEEKEWIKYVTYRIEPLFKDRFQDLIKSKLLNGD